jgi:hypothetical protein
VRHRIQRTTTGKRPCGWRATFDGVYDYVDSLVSTNLNTTAWSISLLARLISSVVCSSGDSVVLESANLFVKDWDYRVY